MAKKAKLQRTVECPKCHRKTRPHLLDRIEAMFHIPARYKVKCSYCAEVFYTKADTDNGS